MRATPKNEDLTCNERGNFGLLPNTKNDHSVDMHLLVWTLYSKEGKTQSCGSSLYVPKTAAQSSKAGVSQRQILRVMNQVLHIYIYYQICIYMYVAYKNGYAIYEMTSSLLS